MRLPKMKVKVDKVILFEFLRLKQGANMTRIAKAVSSKVNLDERKIRARLIKLLSRLTVFDMEYILDIPDDYRNYFIVFQSRKGAVEVVGISIDGSHHHMVDYRSSMHTPVKTSPSLDKRTQAKHLRSASNSTTANTVCDSEETKFKLALSQIKEEQVDPNRGLMVADIDILMQQLQSTDSLSVEVNVSMLHSIIAYFSQLYQIPVKSITELICRECPSDLNVNEIRSKLMNMLL